MKKLCVLFAIFCTVAVASLNALTPNERKLVQQIQAELHEAQADYSAATAALHKADDRAANAEVNAAQTAAALHDLQLKIDAAAKREATLKAEVAKMKPVYDQCTAHGGLGAIAYGVGELAKHLLFAIAVIAVLGVGLWILSLAVPVTAPFIKIGLGIVGKIFAGAGRAVAAFFVFLHNVLAKILAKKPAPPAPPSPPDAPKAQDS